MPAQLLSTSEGATLILTLSNPEHRNALGPEMYAAGVEALNVAETSTEIKSVVITGEGPLFSAGGNLQRLNNNRLSTKPKASKACTTGLKPFELFPSQSLRLLKGLPQAQDFLWLWPAT